MSHLSPYLQPTYVDFPILSHPILSTASTTIALAVHDLILGDEHEMVNHVCILAATQGDGNLLCSDSFQEKDLVELSVGLGQAHLEGVQQLSDTEMVLTFWFSSQMMAAMCLFHCGHGVVQ